MENLHWIMCKMMQQRDIVVKYKPTKKVMIKLFNANRTSEFNGLNGLDKTQNHTRVVFSYKF